MTGLGKQLERFLATRDINQELESYLKEHERLIRKTLYRGLPFPLHLLKEGAVVEEWNGSTHWTIDEKVARGFADDYINEDYYEELQEELGVDEVDFACLVLVIEDLEGIEIAQLIKEHGIQGYLKEKEVTAIGKDFVIQSIETKEIDNEIYHYACVKAIS